MSYIHDLCNALVQVLDHAAGLHVHRLAGYVANLDFWLAEVEHGLAVVDGYGGRFARTKRATKEYAKAHPEWRPGSSSSPNPPTSPAFSDQELWELREKVLSSVRKFLVRCERAGLLEAGQMAEVCQRWRLEEVERK